MTPKPFLVPRFGGLNLDSDPEEVGAEGCVDMLNVDLDRAGRARTRDGVNAFTDAISGSTAATTYNVLPINAAGLNRLAIVTTNAATPRVYLSTAARGGTPPSDPDPPLGSLGAQGDWSGVHRSMCRFGTPTSDVLFIASSTETGTGGAVTLRKWDGSTLATSTGSPRHIDVSPQSNRLIQGGFASAADSPTGANGSAYTVFWSDAGAPETYSANSYIHFNPGDGFRVEAVKTWRDSTFIFKGNCFYVVFAETVDGDGNPEFLFRRVDIEGLLYTTGLTGYGCSVAAGSDGVYYATTRGVYRTTGGTGVLVSQAISPVFTDLGSDFHLASFRSMSFAKGRLHLNLQLDDDSERTFVFDPATGNWLLWSSLAKSSRFMDWRTSVDEEGSEERIFFAANGKVHFFDPSYTTDASVAIASRYTSGIYDLGTPGQDAYTRYTRVLGYGTPTVSVFTDHGSTDTNAAAVTLGTAPAVAEGYHSKSYKGRLFQHKLSATSGAWAASRIIQDVEWVRP